MTLTDCNGFDIETGDSLRCRACNGRLFDLKAGAKICTHWRDGRGAGEFEIVGRPTGPPAPPGINVLLRGDGMPKEGKTVTIDIGFIMGAKRNPDVPEVRTVSSEAEYRELYGTPSGGVFDPAATPMVFAIAAAHQIPVEMLLPPERSFPLDYALTYRWFRERVRKIVAEMAPTTKVTTDFAGPKGICGPMFVAFLEFGSGVTIDYAWRQDYTDSPGFEIDLRELIKEAQLEIGQGRTR